MKVSLFNYNLVREDATGTCMINQVQFFRRRGDHVRVYVVHPPERVPAEVEAVTSVVTLADLISGQEEHFCQSDLYIYHYPSRHELMESILTIDKGIVIFYYHNVTPPELWGGEAVRDTLAQGVKGRALVHYADLCIADSPFNKQELVEQVGYDADRIRVLPLAVPLEQLVPGSKDAALVQAHQLEGQHVLLFLGRMAWNKRIDLLIEALVRVQREVPDTKLLLVGDDRTALPYRETVAAARSLARELGVAEDVIWTGRVDELAPYFHLADVYVTASLHEGFGVPLIEAMACGVPVVASRIGAMPWVLGEAGLLFEPGNVDQLAEQIVQVLRDADLRQTLIQRGLDRVQAFSLERYTEGLADIVNWAVAHIPPRTSQRLPGPAGKDTARQQISPGPSEMLLRVLAERIASDSDIAWRDYQVHSSVPVVGSLIAWLRRNLTSHLREPYLDPMIDRQVRLNRQIAGWMRWAASTLILAQERQIELEDQVRTLEIQIEALSRRQGKEES